jgi:uncharacterized protein
MPEFIELAHWPVFLLAATAIFLGSVAQASTGIGFGMVAAPALMLIDQRFVPGPVLVLSMLISFLAAQRERQSIHWRRMSLALDGRILGTLFAALTISLLPTSSYGLVFGVLVILAVVLSLTGWRPLPSTKNLLAAGFASGYMGTLTAIGAPPIALVYQHATPAEIRSTMAGYFVVGTAFSIITLALIGRFDTEEIFASILFVPPLMAGFWVSGFVLAQASRNHIRIAILTLSSISAVALIAKSLTA